MLIQTFITLILVYTNLSDINSIIDYIVPIYVLFAVWLAFKLKNSKYIEPNFITKNKIYESKKKVVKLEASDETTKDWKEMFDG